MLINPGLVLLMGPKILSKTASAHCEEVTIVAGCLTFYMELKLNTYMALTLGRSSKRKTGLIQSKKGHLPQNQKLMPMFVQGKWTRYCQLHCTRSYLAGKLVYAQAVSK